MAILFYDREAVEQFPDLLENYKHNDNRAIAYVMLSAILILGLSVVLEQSIFFSAVGVGIGAVMSIIAYKIFRGYEPFRIVFAITIVLFSATLVQLNAGTFESHLYFFVSMVVFAFYNDVKPLTIASVLAILTYLFLYKLQGNSATVFNMPITIFEHNYSLETLLTYLAAIAAEWYILRWLISQSRESFFRALDADDEIFEKFKELQIYDVVYDYTDNGIIVTTPEGLILSANRAFESLTGYSEEFLIGKNPRIFKSDKQSITTYRSMWSALEHGRRWEGEIWNKCEDGKVALFLVHINAIVVDGDIYHYIGVYMERSKLDQASKKMNFMAQHDALTELLNRDSFVQQVKHAIFLSYSVKQPFAIISINLDRFKNVNDTMGHDAGDKLIVSVSKRIRDVLKQSDIVARPGGDEFLVLLEKIRSENEVAQVASQILKSIKKPFEINSQTIHTSASIGISLYPDDGEDASLLVKAAESAMYQAKNGGNNSFEFFTSDLSKQVLRNMKLENALHGALDKGEMFLVFQPQHNIENGKLISAEVLIRWNSKEFGFVGPNEFIPIAEESGLIVELGEWVFRNACIAIRSYKVIYPDLRHLAVNVSSEQFIRYDIAKEFPRIAAEEGVDTSDIEIELTERSVMQQAEDGENVLDTLRTLGFKISIDDFGTGYSSMSYLKSLPIDVVKVDKSFIDGLPHDESDVAIVKAILALVQSLGYDTVAEGIEYKEQAEMLQELGCDIAQGYYYSKPLTHKDFLDYLEKAINA
ncbi:MAG: EAL domain-containing protein [Campylobacterota bacterium]|nr:EAL domain-containing protein [Campylobacterota bacterium]